MDGDADDMSYTASPIATSNAGKCATTSTYDIYMVDTPKDDEGDKEPPKHRHERHRGKGAGNGHASNTTTDNGDAIDNSITPDCVDDQNTIITLVMKTLEVTCKTGMMTTRRR